MKIAMTGGHHSSALPVIKYLRTTHPEIDLIWYGKKSNSEEDTSDSLEYIEINALGLKFFTIDSGKVYKKINLKQFVKIIKSIVYSYQTLKKESPQTILSFGGYIAVPVVIAAFFLNIPIYTREQTVVSGYANRVIGLLAKKIFVSWKTSEKYYSPSKVIYSGIPLREGIFVNENTNFISDNDLPYLFVLGGKSGSVLINNLISYNLETLLTKFNVIHQCGDNAESNPYVALSERYSAIKDKVFGKYFLHKYILENQIGEAYARAKIVLCRSGAHTVSELLALQKLCVLVPIPWVSHNEQYENAKLLENAGLGLILDEKTLNSDKLLSSLNTVLNYSDDNFKNRVINKDISKKPEEIIVTTIISDICK